MQKCLWNVNSPNLHGLHSLEWHNILGMFDVSIKMRREPSSQKNLLTVLSQPMFHQSRNSPQLNLPNPKFSQVICRSFLIFFCSKPSVIHALSKWFKACWKFTEWLSICINIEFAPGMSDLLMFWEHWLCSWK